MFFSRSLDSKRKYTDDQGQELLDLGESIFTTDNIFQGTSITLSKVRKGMEMRPDIISRAVYGNEDYTELLLKYNNIQNPFAIDSDDVLVLPSAIHIERNVGEKIDDSNGPSEDSLIRQYHKYVDKSKKTDTAGSEKNTTSVPKDSKTQNAIKDQLYSEDKYKEANLANIGSTAIKEVDGRLYFGADADIKCATDGIATSDYLKKVIQNSIDTANNR